MPPDADKLRQRKPVDTVQETADSEFTTTLDKLDGSQVCIDGIVYDISNFDHPGGDSIRVFGGNDVTIQYKMIHPYHTSKHLEKMKRVGKVSDFTSEYLFDTPFEREIKQEVFKIVRRGREFGTPGYFFRCAFYVSLFFVLQYLWVFWGSSIPLAIIYGMSQAFIGLNVQHDANHGACSKRPWINDILGLGADFIGGSKWLWMEQHWTHHSYTNHIDKDPDSFGAEPFIIWNNYPLDDTRRKWMHRLQAFYYLPVLALYWLSSVFNPEIFDLRQRGAQGVGIRMESDFVKSRRKYAIFLRLLYIYVNAVTPFLKHNWMTALCHVFLLGASESLTLAIPFSLSHNFEHCDRDPTRDVRENKKEQVCWFKSQVETSCTYGGFWGGCITGGLNMQVEHHLFPRMSSAWYPYIAPKVREICQKHGVRYAYYPYIWNNLVSTIKYVHQAGTGILHLHGNPLKGNM